MESLRVWPLIVLAWLALGWADIGWGEETIFHPGDILKVSVEVGNPPENIGPLTTFGFGESTFHLTYNPSTHFLEGLFQVPAYAMFLSPVAHVEMDTTAGVWGSITGGRDFTPPRIEGIKNYTAKPVLKNVQAVAKDKTSLSLSYDIQDESGVYFSYIQVLGEFGEQANGPSHRYFTPGDKSDFARCTGDNPSHCTVEMKMPERIPGTPVLGIEVQNNAGTRVYFTSRYPETFHKEKDFDFTWPSRPVTAEDTAEIKMGPVTQVGQTGREVRLRFTVSGDAQFKSASSNADIGDGDSHGDGKMQMGLASHFVYHPETKTVDLTVTLPEKSFSRSIILIPGVEATNDADTFVFLPKEFSKQIDTSVIQVDTTKPQLGAVHYRLATKEEIEAAEKGN